MQRGNGHLAFQEIATLTHRYNTLANGKWKGLMDAAPRQLPVFEDVCGKLSNDELFDAIARNACDYIPSPTTHHQTPTIIQMLGHSINAVSIPKGGELVYEFYSPLLSEGQHTLKIKALDDHIIMDQWMLDFKKDRKFYVIPVK